MAYNCVLKQGAGITGRSVWSVYKGSHQVSSMQMDIIIGIQHAGTIKESGLEAVRPETYRFPWSDWSISSHATIYVLDRPDFLCITDIMRWSYISPTTSVYMYCIRDIIRWSLLTGLVYRGLTPQQQPGSYQGADGCCRPESTVCRTGGGGTVSAGRLAKRPCPLSQLFYVRQCPA